MSTGRKVFCVSPARARIYVRRQERTRALALYLIGASGRRPEAAAAALKREERKRKEGPRG
jgi:hypothetical protein